MQRKNEKNMVCCCVGQASPDNKDNSAWKKIRSVTCQAKPDLRVTTTSAFTLIELLVVVLIIGILAAVALPKYEMAVMRSRYATLKANVNALLDAEKIYYLSNGEYTNDMEALSIDLTGCTLSSDKRTCTYPWGYCMLDAASNSKRVHCQATTNLQNAYVHYWERPTFGSATCWALTTDRTDKYNKLCEKEGGNYITTTTCTKPCVVYKLAD